VRKVALLRVRALEQLIRIEAMDSETWNAMLAERDSTLISGIIRLLTESELVLSEEQLVQLFANTALPHKSGLADMVVAFIRRGAPYTSKVFEPLGTSSVWPIKYDCVRRIIELDDADAVITLAKFSSMSYWQARGRIATYLHERHEQGRMSPEERELALEMLVQITTDGKTEPKTPTMRKAKDALDSIRNDGEPDR